MNLSSIVCHTLASRGSALWHAALVADIVCTGSSSLGLILKQVLAAPTTPAAARTAVARCWAICATLMVAAAANLHVQLPWAPEAVYLGTTAVAATLTVHRLYWRRAAAQQGQLQVLLGSLNRAPLPVLLLGTAAVGLMLLCLPLDPLLCGKAGPWLGTVPFLFLGSDLGFVALAMLEAQEGRTGGAAHAHKAN